jgi:hypothetical protein
MRTAVPHNVVQSFRNVGISLILDDDRVVKCDITPNTGRRIIGRPFAGPRGNLVPREEDEGEDLNLEILELEVLDLWESEGIRK